MLFGVIFLAIGVALLLEGLGILTGSVWTFFWAVLFILVGIKMTTGHGRGKCMCDWVGHEGMMHEHGKCCGHEHEKEEAKGKE